MKRLMIVGIVGLALLAGCTTQPALQETDYVQLVHENVPEMASTTTNQLRKVGKAICGLIETGSWLSTVQTVTDSNITAYHAGQFINFSVNMYCPNQKNKLPK